MKKVLIVIVLIVILGVAAFAVLNTYIYEEKQADTGAYTFGSYAYRCEDGTEFSIAPSEDMTSILITPAPDAERVPGTILSQAESESGARYEGNGISFHGVGETVTLTMDGAGTVCRPIVSQDEAPMNFGD